MSGTDGAEEWVVAALGPSLIVYDTAAVIRRDGRLVYIYIYIGMTQGVARSPSTFFLIIVLILIVNTGSFLLCVCIQPIKAAVFICTEGGPSRNNRALRIEMSIFFTIY